MADSRSSMLMILLSSSLKAALDAALNTALCTLPPSSRNWQDVQNQRLCLMEPQLAVSAAKFGIYINFTILIVHYLP